MPKHIAFPTLLLLLSVLLACKRTSDTSSSGTNTSDGSTAVAPAAPTPSASAAPACDDIAGTWSTKGSCGPDICVVTQTGCSTSFKCSGGAASYAGTVTGRTFKYSGTAANGSKGSCEGTHDGTKLTGTCSGVGNPCAFTATKK